MTNEYKIILCYAPAIGICVAPILKGAKSRAENQLTSSKNALADALELHRSPHTKILQQGAIAIFLLLLSHINLTPS